MNSLRATALLLGCLLAPAALAQPVIRYTFDEASGNALDTGAAPATDAAFEGGATRSTDTPSGSGRSLDLRTDSPYAFVSAPDAAELDGFTTLTLTTWLKIESYPSNPSNNKRLIAQQAGGATFPGFSFNMNATTNNGEPASASNFRLGLFVGSADTFGSGFSDADAGAAEWTFLAATYDSALGEMKFFTGGVATPVAQLGNTVFPTASPAPVESTARFGVGLTDAAATSDTSVTGWQDDVRAYNAALDLAALEAVRLENLTGGPPLADGDFNSDGKVDGVDLAAWQGGFGATGAATRAQGDADRDQDVDGADLLVWQRDFAPGAAAVTTVPEPTAAAMGLAGLCWRAAGRRRRR